MQLLMEKWALTKQLCGRSTAQPALVKNKDGHPLSTEHEQAKRWVEYFKDVLNCSESDDPASPVPAEEDLELDLDPPTLEEVKHAIWNSWIRHWKRDSNYSVH